MLKLLLGLLPVLFLLHTDSFIEIKNQTAEEEADYAWGVIRDINFFEKNKYQISLPAVKNIEELKEKGRVGKLTNADYEDFKNEFTRSVYNLENYAPALAAVNSVKGKINAGRKIIEQYDSLGIMKLYDKYCVKLTLYGSGGSYHPESGEIILMAFRNGTFKNNRAPQETILHEMTHLGLEEKVIQKCGLNHVEKERLVDLFCAAHFKDILPDYKMQNMGFNKLDKYFRSKADWKNLYKQIEKYKEEN
jgi:hypothetical protein